MTARGFGTVVATVLACVLVGVGVGLWHDGCGLYFVHTGSMEPTLLPGDVVFDRPVAKGTLRPGEIITFRHSGLSTDVVTHRFTGYTATGLIHTKGDANSTADAWEIRPDQVKGTVAVTVPRIGYLLVFLKQPPGIGAIVTTLLALMLLWGLFFPAAATKAVRPAHRRSRDGRHLSRSN